MEWLYVVTLALTVIPLDIIRKLVTATRGKNVVGV
jgi:hypothetical protein